MVLVYSIAQLVHVVPWCFSFPIQSTSFVLACGYRDFSVFDHFVVRLICSPRTVLVQELSTAPASFEGDCISTGA